MGKDTNKPQIVTIDGTEYSLDDFTEQQRLLVEHVADLDRKLGSARFSLDQMQVGRDAFFKMLKEALETKPEANPEVADVEAK